ncbi:MAG: hypothetical protein IPK97_20425 [Ahniella sp.]|nr:hypothetical protein [Ahniella sp.]
MAPQTRYGYDEAKRIKLIEHLRGGAAFLTLSYEYDANGNREEERRIESGLPGQGSRTILSVYGFDDDDRLTDVTVTHTPADPQVPDTRTVWTLDGVGNRRSETVTNLSNSQVLNQKVYDYNARDQLTEVADSITGTTVRFGYDANGNRTSREVWRGAPLSLASRIEYLFDARDRLVRADPAPPNPINAPTVQFVYDAEDRKFARIETPWLNGAPVPANAKATVQLYDGDQLIHEGQPSTEPASNTPNAQGLKLTDTYRRSAMMDRHVAFGAQGTGGGTTNPDSTIRFYQLDALGTPIGLSNEQGQAIVSNTLDAWGNPVQQTAEGQSSAPVHSGNQSQDPNQTGQAALLSNDQQAIGFTGYQKDEALGLYYANARFYDPLVGAFGATDPWAGDPSRPVTLNKFLYANGNPVVFVDPSGKYGEAGHFYTTFVVARMLDIQEKEAKTLALYSQLPDEIGKFDAINQAVRGATREYAKLHPIFRGLVEPDQLRIYDTNMVQDYFHALTGFDSEYETKVSRQTVIAAESPEAAGLAIHRLGDSFAHRQLGNETKTYVERIGHLFDGHEPDKISTRPALYGDYVEELARTLAAREGKPVSNERIMTIRRELEAIGMEEVSAESERNSEAFSTISTTNEGDDLRSDLAQSNQLTEERILNRLKAKALSYVKENASGLRPLLEPEKASTNMFLDAQGQEASNARSFVDDPDTGRLENIDPKALLMDMESAAIEFRKVQARCRVGDCQ